ANEVNKHTVGMNWVRDASITRIVDVRNVQEGDPSPDGKGTLKIKRGIEVGHIFQLGDKYSQALKATVSGEDGKPVTLTLRCYCSDLLRTSAAAIEQNSDGSGIMWQKTQPVDDSFAPFEVAITPMKSKKEPVMETATALYEEIKPQRINVQLDARNERP